MEKWARRAGGLSLWKFADAGDTRDNLFTGGLNYRINFGENPLTATLGTNAEQFVGELDGSNFRTYAVSLGFNRPFGDKHSLRLRYQLQYRDQYEADKNTTWNQVTGAWRYTFWKVPTFGGATNTWALEVGGGFLKGEDFTDTSANIQIEVGLGGKR